MGAEQDAKSSHTGSSCRKKGQRAEGRKPCIGREQLGLELALQYGIWRSRVTGLTCHTRVPTPPVKFAIKSKNGPTISALPRMLILGPKKGNLQAHNWYQLKTLAVL